MEIKTIDLDKVDPVTPTVHDRQIDPPKPIKKDMSAKSNVITVIIFLIAAIAGFYSGASLKMSSDGKLVGSSSNDLGNIQADIPAAGVKVGDIYGSADEKSFKDSATGVIDKGGFNGEGTHKLVRPGGVSQTVYLTSSVIDIDTLVGHQVTIWGETFKGQKVGWLMDVGRVKVENLNVPLPK